MAQLKPILSTVDLRELHNHCCSLEKIIKYVNEGFNSTVSIRLFSGICRYIVGSIALSPTNINKNISLTEDKNKMSLESTTEEFPNKLLVLLRYHGKLSPYNKVQMQDSVISSMTYCDMSLSNT